MYKRQLYHCQYWCGIDLSLSQKFPTTLDPRDFTGLGWNFRHDCFWIWQDVYKRQMPGMDGVLATKEVKEHYPDIKIIILTTFDDDEFIYSALKYGASGYLLKGASTEELYKAIKVVYQGGAMINPNIASKVFQIFSQMAKTNFSIAVDEDNVKDLSTTEWRIIQEVGYGESNKEIAAKLFLSEGTVRNYLSTILAKLNLRDRTQLAIWSVQTGVTRRDFSKGNTE